MSEFTFLKNRLYDTDPLWQVQVTVLVALILQLALPDRLVAGPKYVLPLLEAGLLVLLIATTPREPIFRSIARRVNAVVFIALISLGNFYSLERVAHALLAGGHVTDGRTLLLASINIFITNVIIFGLWYWELDGGGPGHRRRVPMHERDFLFPQMDSPQFAPRGWQPTFIDYLYVSATNATAFSPTDTMPLSRRAKILMAVQAVASLITLALVAARAVNILS